MRSLKEVDLTKKLNLLFHWLERIRQAPQLNWLEKLCVDLQRIKSSRTKIRFLMLGYACFNAVAPEDSMRVSKLKQRVICTVIEWNKDCKD